MSNGASKDPLPKGPYGYHPYKDQVGAAVVIPDCDDPVLFLQIPNTVGLPKAGAEALARAIRAIPNLLAASAELMLERDRLANRLKELGAVDCDQSGRNAMLAALKLVHEE